MTTSYPGALDNFVNPSPGTVPLATPFGGRTHSQEHGDLNDAVEAIQAKVGITGSTVAGSLDFLANHNAAAQAPLAVGTSNIPREMINSSSVTTGTQVLRLSYFFALKTLTSTQARILAGGTAAAATPTLVRVGLYSIDGAGNGTLVASTPNDTTLLAAANTSYTKSWSSSIALVAGTQYALGLLVVTAAAAPTMCGMSIASANEAAVVPRQSGQITGQADLPASFVTGAPAVSGSYVYAALS